jgi:hypothetical protein
MWHACMYTFYRENLKEDLAADKKILLKWVFKKTRELYPPGSE